jgi:RHS repeat-associated protein
MLPANWMPQSDPMIPPFRDVEVKNGIQAPHVASRSNKERFRHKSMVVNELQPCSTPKKTGGVTVYGYRHYTPKTGQFLGRDPIGESGGMNLYGAFYNNGVDNFDPDGRFVNFLIGAAVGAVIDYGMQVSYNVAVDGATWNAFVDVDITSIGVSALIGTVAPGAGKALQGIAKGFKAQEKAIKIAEKVGRRKNLLNRQKLLQRAKDAAKAEGSAWKDVQKVTAAIVASKIGKKVANEVLDDIKQQLGNDVCPEEENESLKIDATFKWNGDAGEVEVTTGDR